jgi:hypothetical protein
MTLKEMYKEFPDQWLFIIEPEISDNTELLGGIVYMCTDSREEILKACREYNGNSAIRYTGDMPEGIAFLL